MSLLKNIRLSSASRQCAACSGWPVAAGTVSAARVISKDFTRSKQRYGAPRLTDELRAQGYPFNAKTVEANLRRQVLREKASRKFSPVSYRTHNLPVSENLLEQDFYASGPNQKWAGDITYLRTDEGWLYLAVVIDLWPRAVISWSMSSRMTAQLACDVLQMALWRRKSPRHVIVHTDRMRSVLFSKLSGAVETA